MADHFERLGLPRRFSVDASAIERSYLAQSRALHPDFHGAASTADQQAALALTASLNQAYVTLKDPFRRAEYLLSLLGGPTAGQDKGLDQAFLMEMMEARERTDELRAAGESLSELEADLERQYAGVLAEVGTAFEKPDLQPADLIAIRRRLNAAKTLQSLLRDLRGTPDLT